MQDYWKLDYQTVCMILENYHELATGAQPESPPGFDNPETKRTGVSNHGWFENSCLLAAEVASRVKRCGLDGMLVEERYGLDWTAPKLESQISAERGIKIDKIHASINKVIWYCVGRKRKRISYEDWKKGKHYRKTEANLSVTDNPLDKSVAKCY